MSEDLLQQYGIFLIGAGLSLALILTLLLLLRRNAVKKRGPRPAVKALLAQQEAGTMPVLNDGHDIDMGERGLSEGQPSLQQPDAAIPDDSVAKNASGFQLFKRKKAKKASASHKLKQPETARLMEIEQEMLAIRELFRTGEISRTVYVAETKALYETARLLNE